MPEQREWTSDQAARPELLKDALKEFDCDTAAVQAVGKVTVFALQVTERSSLNDDELPPVQHTLLRAGLSVIWPIIPIGPVVPVRPVIPSLGLRVGVTRIRRKAVTLRDQFQAGLQPAWLKVFGLLHSGLLSEWHRPRAACSGRSATCGTVYHGSSVTPMEKRYRRKSGRPSSGKDRMRGRDVRGFVLRA